MAEIFPFAAYRYSAERVALEKALTQPYDKITPAMQERYYTLSPYNLIAVEKGRATANDGPGNNVYTRAASTLEQWIADGVLVRDARPAIYAYSQEYRVPGTNERKLRQGFIALGRVYDYAEGVVFRHEQTLAGPRTDRLELLRHTGVHTGQLFMLYSDPQSQVDSVLEEIARLSPTVEVTDELGAVHRLWPVSDALQIEKFVRTMADKKLVIADGHHRYETAWAYRNERRAALGRVDPNAPHEKVMMTLVNIHSAGLTILPTHRVVRDVPDFSLARLRVAAEAWLEWAPFAFSSAGARQAAWARFHAALTAGDGPRRIGVYAGGGAFHLLSLRRDADLASALPDLLPAQRNLDVVLVHHLLLEKGLGISPAAVASEQNLRYEREMGAAIDAVDGGQAQACFLLNPVRVEQVYEMALAGIVLPQKSTDFYPKLLSGIAIYRLGE